MFFKKNSNNMGVYKTESKSNHFLLLNDVQRHDFSRRGGSDGNMSFQTNSQD